MKLTKQQWTAVAVFALNLLVLTPSVWIVSYLFNENRQWRDETEQLVDRLRTDVSAFKSEVAKDYATKSELQSHADRVNDRLINMMIPRKP